MTEPVGTSLTERYLLVRSIGSGGMGNVFEAIDRDSKRPVAVKRVALRGDRASEAAARFRRELLATAQITSRHVVAIHDGGVDNDGPYIVMDLLVGEDLGSMLDRLGGLPCDVALRIAAQACEGLIAAHALGIVHRDIKPSNLFVVAPTTSGERIVKILDFGIARLAPLAGIHELTDLTRTGEMVGSPLYMAPEQLRGARDLDHRADVWSLGVVLFRLLSGSLPHTAESLADLLIMVCSQPAPPIRTRAPWVPERVAAVVDRALAIDPAARTPSARALGDQLAALLPHGHAIFEEMIVAHQPPALDLEPSLPRRGSVTAPPNLAGAALSQPTPVVGPHVQPTAVVTPAPVVYAERRWRGSLVVLAALVAVLVWAGRRAWQEYQRSREPPEPELGPAPDLSAGLPAKLAATAGASWFATTRTRCNAIELRDALATSPPPDGDDGHAFAAACAAIAGDLAYARKLIAATDDPKYASWPTFSVAHPLADRQIDDRVVADILRLVLEFWPENFLAHYHVGLAAFIHGEPAEHHLREFVKLYPQDDEFLATGRALLNELGQPGRPGCDRVVVIDPEGHRIRPPGCPP